MTARERLGLPPIHPCLSEFSTDQLDLKRLSGVHTSYTGPRAPCEAVCWFLNQTASFFLHRDRWCAQWGSHPTDVSSYVQVDGGRGKDLFMLLGNIIWPVSISQRLQRPVLFWLWPHFICKMMCATWQLYKRWVSSLLSTSHQFFKMLLLRGHWVFTKPLLTVWIWNVPPRLLFEF